MELDKVQGVEIPSLDWEITDVLDDIIMAQFVDTDNDGQHIQRNGIYIKVDPAKQLWRVGRVIAAGPKCSDKIKTGVFILFPNDRGIQVPQVGGYKNVAFINEPRIFGICKPTPEQLKRLKAQNKERNK